MATYPITAHPSNLYTSLLMITLAAGSTGCSPSAEQLAATRAELRKTIGLPEGPLLKPVSTSSKSANQPSTTSDPSPSIPSTPTTAATTPDLSPANKEPSTPSAPTHNATSSETPSAWVDLNSLPRMQWEILYVGNRPVGYTRRTIEIAKDEFASSEQPLLSIEAESRVRIKTKAANSSDQSVVISSLETPQGQQKT